MPLLFLIISDIIWLLFHSITFGFLGLLILKFLQRLYMEVEVGWTTRLAI